MKYFKFICLFFILSGCVTNETVNESNEQGTPLWVSDPYSLLSQGEYIAFLGRGKTFKSAEDQAKRAAKDYIDYIDLNLEKELLDDDGDYYLLYSISIEELEENLRQTWSSMVEDYISNVDMGDSTSNILQKYSHYKSAIEIYNNFSVINEIDPEIEFEIPDSIEEDHEFVVENFNFTDKEIEFSVNVEGDIDNLIKDSIKEELHRLGYGTSENGLIQFNANLTLSDVDLDNSYINKFWSISLSISDLDGYSSKSIVYKGRESQITDEALNQSIARSVVRHIQESLIKMLP